MRWMNTRIAIALVASLGLVVGPACSDDDTSTQENDNSAQQDAGDDVGDPDAGDTGVPDDAGEDEDTGDEDTDAGYEEDADVEDPDDNQFDVEPVDCAYPADDLDECDEEEGDFGPASFFSKFEIETSDEPGEQCCFDVDGEGGIDNQIGEVVVPLIEAAGIPGFDDVNENLFTSIKTGELTYLLESYGWDHPQWDNDLSLRVYKGGQSTGDFMEGEGEFEVSAANFDDDGNPLYGFDNVEVRDSALAAEGGRIRIMFPGLVSELGADLEAVQMVGRVEQNPEPDLEARGQFEIVDGRLGGAVIRNTFFKSLNREALGCDCLDLPDDIDYDDPNLYEDGIFIYSEGEPGSWACDVKEAPDSGNICEDSTDPVCYTLGDQSLCAGLSLISNNTDVVIDGEHAYSLGIRFESVPATIVGVEGE